MRSLTLSLLFVASVASAQEPPATDTCDPPFTSWGTPTSPCAVGLTCANIWGERVEVLYLNPEARLAYVRDVDRKLCTFAVNARQDVMYATSKAFKYADCQLPMWQIEEEFGGYPKQCYPRSVVFTVKGGLVTLTTPSAK